MKRKITNLFRPWFRVLGVPIHPITIVMLIAWSLGPIGVATNQSWMVFIMPVIAILTVLFWLWVRMYPLKPHQWTEREKEYMNGRG